MTDQKTLRAKFDKMDEARLTFASENGDGFGHHDFHGADEYVEDGYAIAEAAFKLDEEDWEDFTEAEIEKAPANAQYLVALAVNYRLAELEAEAAKDCDSWFNFAADVALAPFGGRV